MGDYASQLFGMISGVGDSYQEGRRQRIGELNADRNYQQQLNEFDWRQNTDQRDYMRQLNRDQVGDSQWQQSFGADQAYRNRSLGLDEQRLAIAQRAADRRETLPIINSKMGLYDPNTKSWIEGPPAAAGGSMIDNETFDNVSGLRKEVQQLPSYKNFAQAQPIYNSMMETAGRNSKASDLNLVYGLGKIMDPNSVVREGEMVMVKNTASLPDWLQGAIAQLNGGAALTPETRQAIMTEAYGRTKGYSDAFSQDVGQYRDIAKRYGINEADVLPPLGGVQEWKQPDWNDLGGGVRMRQVR